MISSFLLLLLLGDKLGRLLSLLSGALKQTPPEATAIKLFMSVSYKCLQYARVCVPGKAFPA